MADIDKIKRNLNKMIEQGAPKEHLDGYLASEGFNSPEAFRAAVKAPITADNVVRSLANGATLGYADRAAAGVDAAVGPALNWGMQNLGMGPSVTSQADTYGKRYDENLAREQALTKDFGTAHPNVDTGARVVGGVAGTIAALPRALLTPVAGVGPISRIGGNMLKSGAVGGGIGAVAGSSEGNSLEERGQNALSGAALGGAFGAAVPVAGAVGRAALETAPGRFVSEKIVSPAIRSVANAFSPAVPKSLSAAAADGGNLPPSGLNALADRTGNVAQEGAAQRLATATQRSGKPAEYWQQQIDKRGPEAVLADLDPQFLNMAVGVKTLPGDTKSVAENVLKPRDRATGKRLVQAAEGDEPPPTDYALRGKGQQYDATARTVGENSYQGDMVGAGLKQSPEMMTLYENPYVKSAIDHVLTVEKNARIGRPEAVPASPVEIMHKVKQAIWDMGFDGATARPGANASYYRDLGTDFVTKLKAANPKLAEADAAYAHAKSLPEHYDAGNALFARGTGERAREMSAPALEDLLSGATPDQALAARSGATNALRANTQTLTGARSAARTIDQSGDIRDKLVQLYGPAHAGKIMQQAETEGLFANTSNRLLGGPHTADDLISAGMHGSLALRGTTSGGIRGQALERLSDIINRVVNPNEVVRNALGRTLINTDAGSNKAALRRAAEILQSRRGGNALAPGLSASSAEVGGNY